MIVAMILVTGGTGYLGRALVARLLAQGERVRVLCHDRAATGGEAVPGDVTQPESLERALRGVELVYHLAARVDHHASAEELHRVNVEGSRNVVEAALRHRVGRVVHCSSVSAEPGGGSTAYGRSKIAAEEALQRYRARIPIVSLRPGPIYDEERRNLQRLVRFARLTRLSPRLVPDGTVHLASRRNVVDALLLARDRGAPGRAYAICDAQPIARSALAQSIARHTGARSLPLPLPLLRPLLYGFAVGSEALHAVCGLRPRLDRHYLKVLTRERRYDIAPAVADLGYRPAVTELHFDEAVRACLRDSAQHAARDPQA